MEINNVQVRITYVRTYVLTYVSTYVLVRTYVYANQKYKPLVVKDVVKWAMAFYEVD